MRDWSNQFATVPAYCLVASRSKSATRITTSLFLFVIPEGNLLLSLFVILGRRLRISVLALPLPALLFVIPQHSGEICFCSRRHPERGRKS
jgi:hypothetical protein